MVEMGLRGSIEAVVCLIGLKSMLIVQWRRWFPSTVHRPSVVYIIFTKMASMFLNL